MTVTPDTIAVALGRSAPVDGSAEDQQWQMWISDALMLIEARLGDPSLLDQAKLDYVVREAVVDHIRHPDDATKIDVSVDDASVSKTYRSGSGRVSIRDEWWNLLAPTTRNTGAFSIQPTGSAGGHSATCSTVFGALYCDCGYDIAGFPLFGGGE